MWHFSQWLLIFYEKSLTMKVTYQTCCGVNVYTSFLPVTIVKTTGALSLLPQRNPPLTIQFLNSSNGLSTMIAMMSVWNPLLNTESLYLIFLKMISMLSLPIPNGLKQSKATKMIPNILNRSEIYSV